MNKLIIVKQPVRNKGEQFMDKRGPQDSGGQARLWRERGASDIP